MSVKKLVIFLLIFICSCNVIEQSDGDTNDSRLTGSWTYYNDVKEEDDNSFKDETDDEESPERAMISVFRNGTFTKILGAEYIEGNWRYSASRKLAFLETVNGIDTIYITDEKIKKREQIILSDGSGEMLTFIKSAVTLKNFEEDPFYKTNNRWRIKPLNAEDSNALFQRVGNYVMHLAFLLKAASERKLNVVSFRNSLGMIKIYDGGIGVHPKDIVPQSWKNTFFDEAQAFVAYENFAAYLYTKRYKGKSTGNWVVDDSNILLSIYKDISEGRFPDARRK